MPVLPALKSIFDAMNSPGALADHLPVTEARAAVHAMIDSQFGALAAPQAPLPFERDFAIASGDAEITLRVYRPDANIAAPLPCHVNYHGGGFWLGTLEQSDTGCRAMVRDLGCVVVSVDYRLAPEAKFPAAAEDCYAALCWVAENCASIGIDPARISVGGGSAGGNLASVVALMARDRGGPEIVFQVLEIPVTDLTALGNLDFPEEGLSISSGKKVYGDYYIREPDDALHPYASPLLAPDLSRLPPALVMCAEYDPLQPEGAAYAARLSDAGVAVEYTCWPGQFHGSQNMAAIIPDEAAAYRAQIAEALRRAYATG